MSRNRVRNPGRIRRFFCWLFVIASMLMFISYVQDEHSLKLIAYAIICGILAIVMWAWQRPSHRLN